jgi:transposase InsO family protein
MMRRIVFKALNRACNQLHIVANRTAENLALRQQLLVLKRGQKRPPIKSWDRIFWVVVSRIWSGWRGALLIVKPDKVVRRHRQGFKAYWRRKSRSGKRGRPPLDPAIKSMVIKMAIANPTWGAAPRFLLRDRDSIYGDTFRQRVLSMGIEEVMAAYESPWQNAYVERLHGSVRRECLDHVIVFNENHLRRVLGDYLAYYHEDRTHLELAKETPTSRPTSSRASPSAKLVALPRVGGLHHRYEWSEAA